MKQPRTTVPFDKTYFSSDWHLSHANVIRFDNRPFANITEMDEHIISNFSQLKEDDHLFFLGDLSFQKDPAKVLEVIKPIKCKIYWVIGNHDTHLLKHQPLLDRFEWVLPIAEIYVTEPSQPKQKVVLCHYSMEVWNKSHHGSYHLFGHSHGSLAYNPERLSLDVGCNLWQYKPVSYEKVKWVMSMKHYKPVDHHTPETK